MALHQLLPDLASAHVCEDREALCQDSVKGWFEPWPKWMQGHRDTVAELFLHTRDSWFRATEDELGSK